MTRALRPVCVLCFVESGGKEKAVRTWHSSRRHCSCTSHSKADVERRSCPCSQAPRIATNFYFTLGATMRGSVQEGIPLQEIDSRSSFGPVRLSEDDEEVLLKNVLGGSFANDSWLRAPQKLGQVMHVIASAALSFAGTDAPRTCLGAC